MKKKFCLLLTALTFLASHILALSNTFAIDTYIKPSILLSVNGQMNDIIKSSEELKFVARLSGDYSPTESITWSWNAGNGDQTQTTAITNGTATLTLAYSDLSVVIPEKNYFMNAEYSDTKTTTSAQVPFSIMGDRSAVIFIEPGISDTFSINDPIHLKIKTVLGGGAESISSIKWNCSGGNISAGYTCPADNTKEAEISFRKAGTYEITVTITDNKDAGNTAKTTINVINDPPKVEVQTDKNPNDYRPGDTAKVKVFANDKYGTINKIEWGCSENDTISFDGSYILSTPTSSVKDYEIDLSLPNIIIDNYQCKFRVTDDDGEQGFATIVFKTSLPTSTEVVDAQDIPDAPESGAVTKESGSVTEDFAPFITLIVLAGIVTIVSLLYFAVVPLFVTPDFH